MATPAAARREGVACGCPGALGWSMPSVIWRIASAAWCRQNSFWPAGLAPGVTPAGAAPSSADTWSSAGKTARASEVNAAGGCAAGKAPVAANGAGGCALWSSPETA